MGSRSIMDVIAQSGAESRCPASAACVLWRWGRSAGRTHQDILRKLLSERRLAGVEDFRRQTSEATEGVRMTEEFPPPGHTACKRWAP